MSNYNPPDPLPPPLTIFNNVNWEIPDVLGGGGGGGAGPQGIAGPIGPQGVQGLVGSGTQGLQGLAGGGGTGTSSPLLYSGGFGNFIAASGVPYSTTITVLPGELYRMTIMGEITSPSSCTLDILVNGGSVINRLYNGGESFQMDISAICFNSTSLRTTGISRSSGVSNVQRMSAGFTSTNAGGVFTLGVSYSFTGTPNITFYGVTLEKLKV